METVEIIDGVTVVELEAVEESVKGIDKLNTKDVLVIGGLMVAGFAVGTGIKYACKGAKKGYLKIKDVINKKKSETVEKEAAEVPYEDCEVSSKEE